MEFNSLLPQFFQFLREDLFISHDELEVVLNRQHPSISSETNLPMLLWQYGLISSEQLQHIWDWIDRQTLLIIL